MKSLLTTANLGYNVIEKNNKLPQQSMWSIEGSTIENNPPIVQCVCNKNEDSIMDTVNTGLGSENIIIVECPKPNPKIPLCKENYLGEFDNIIEKQLARYNLNVYSKEEVDKIVTKLVNSNINNLITRSEVETMINELDFVNSELKALVDYQIPNNLFKL